MAGVQLRAEVLGRVVPVGYAVRYPPACGRGVVTVRTTASASAGTPFVPAIGTDRVPWAATAPMGTPVPFRVSATRVGTTAVKAVSPR